MYVPPVLRCPDLPASTQEVLFGWFDKVMALGVHRDEEWCMILGHTRERWGSYRKGTVPVPPRSVWSLLMLLDALGGLPAAAELVKEWERLAKEDRRLQEYLLHYRANELLFSVYATPSTMAGLAALDKGVRAAHYAVLGQEGRRSALQLHDLDGISEEIADWLSRQEGMQEVAIKIREGHWFQDPDQKGDPVE